MRHVIGTKTGRTEMTALAAGLLAVWLFQPVQPAQAAQAAEEKAARPLVQYDLRVDGMTCPFCVATSEKALKQIPGIHFVHTHLKRGLIHVCAEQGTMPDDAALARLFQDRGFTYRSQKKIGPCPVDEDGRMREEEE